MENKFLKYVEYCENINDWYKLLETKKDVIKNVFSCMDEKGIELANSWQMMEIFLGIQNGLTVEQIMVYVVPRLGSGEWGRIRKAIEVGVPIERINPYVKFPDLYKWIDIERVKQEYFVELLCSEEKDKTEV